jgi:hypothetical protein
MWLCGVLCVCISPLPVSKDRGALKGKWSKYLKSHKDNVHCIQ